MRRSSRILSFLKVSVIGIILIAFAVNARSQTPNPTDPSTTVPYAVRRAAENRANSTPSFDELRRRAQSSAPWPGQRPVDGLSREDLKRIKALMTPDRADVDKYREFLKQDDTGIFRLYPDFDCASRRTISVAGECANQVHRGSTFSFRGSRRFSDVRYNNGRLTGNGFLSHEIFVDLGDVSIDDLNLNSPGVAFLDSLVPSSEFASANKQFLDFARGIEFSGMTFSRSVVPQVDRTYAVRIVAFDNGNSLQNRLWRRTRPEPMLRAFHALHWDKRIDIVVVFRIIRFEDDGNITVVWKQLNRKKAPEIMFAETEALRGFK